MFLLFYASFQDSKIQRVNLNIIAGNQQPPRKLPADYKQNAQKFKNTTILTVCEPIKHASVGLNVALMEMDCLYKTFLENFYIIWFGYWY